MDTHHWQKRNNISPKGLEYISIQKVTEKFNRVHAIIDRIDKDIIRTNLQENKCIFNKIRHIRVISNKIFSLYTNLQNQIMLYM